MLIDNDELSLYRQYETADCMYCMHWNLESEPQPLVYVCMFFLNDQVLVTAAKNPLRSYLPSSTNKNGKTILPPCPLSYT